MPADLSVPRKKGVVFDVRSETLWGSGNREFLESATIPGEQQRETIVRVR